MELEKIWVIINFRNFSLWYLLSKDLHRNHFQILRLKKLSLAFRKRKCRPTPFSNKRCAFPRLNFHHRTLSCLANTPLNRIFHWNVTSHSIIPLFCSGSVISFVIVVNAFSFHSNYSRIAHKPTANLCQDFYLLFLNNIIFSLRRHSNIIYCLPELLKRISERHRS